MGSRIGHSTLHDWHKNFWSEGGCANVGTQGTSKNPPTLKGIYCRQSCWCTPFALGADSATLLFISKKRRSILGSAEALSIYLLSEIRVTAQVSWWTIIVKKTLRLGTSLKVFFTMIFYPHRAPGTCPSTKLMLLRQLPHMCCAYLALGGNSAPLPDEWTVRWMQVHTI